MQPRILRRHLHSHHQETGSLQARMCQQQTLRSYAAPREVLRRSASAARMVSAIGLQVNHCGNARISAGEPSKRTWFLRKASDRDA